jgi:Lrp/AsnC family leucine-responsive transcriptional regulator
MEFNMPGLCAIQACSRRGNRKSLQDCYYDSMVKAGFLGSITTNLDEKDWILLQAVQQDARLSFAELGRRSGLSAPAAAERLRRLEDAGLILGYAARIDHRQLGLSLPVFIEVQVKRTDYPRFQKAVQKLAWVLECHHVAGRSSFFLKVAVPDTQGLELLIGHLSQFGETATTLVLSTVLERREFSRNGSA